MIEGYCSTLTGSATTHALRWEPGIPLSAAPGDRVQFHVSSDAPYTVTYRRLRSRADVFTAVEMAPPFSMPAHVQPLPPEPWLGAGWAVDFTLDVPEWPPGMYAAHCVASSGEDFYVVFVVRPHVGVIRALQRSEFRRRFAVLASTNTWNAYNSWGGRSNYENAVPQLQLGFERPNPNTRPCPPFGKFDFASRHLTRAELWVLTWLEDAGYQCDVFTDVDFHAYSFDPAWYAGLILNTHPEYWSWEMRDRLDAYLNDGGRVLYLGGNGLFERVEFSADLSTMLLRNGDPASDEPRWLFRTQGRPERSVLGVAYEGASYQKKVTGYRTRSPAHRFFRGTKLADGDPFGEIGLTGTTATGEDGKACGWEMDTSKADPGSGAPPDGLNILAESTGDPYASQMTCYDTDTGGFVFSVGSLTFGGSLVLDPILQRIVRNVLNECLAGKRMRDPKGLKPSVLGWIVEGVLGIGPNGRPVPMPGPGPARDIVLALAAGELSNELSSPEERAVLRRSTMEAVARIARRAAERGET